MSDNIINKLVFEADLSINSPSNYALKQSESYYSDYVLPAIEKIIGNYKNRHVRIDGEEEIDLGHVQPHEIAEKLEMLLDELLRKHIVPERRESLRNHYLSSSDFLSKDVFSQESTLTDSGSGLDYLDDLECFFHYLTEPIVPWYIREKEKFDIEAVAEKALKITEESLLYQKRLLEIISKDKSAYIRLTFFLPVTASVWEKLVELKLSQWTGSSISRRGTVEPGGNFYANMLEKLLFKNPPFNPDYHRYLQVPDNSDNSDNSDNPDNPDNSDNPDNHIGNNLGAVLLARTDQRRDEREELRKKNERKKAKKKDGWEELRKKDEWEELRKKDEWEEAKKKDGRMNVQIDNNDVASYEKMTIAAEKKSNQTDNFGTFSDSNPETIRRIPVGNGGLVILHPFLCPLFRNLGLLNKDNNFKSVKKQTRAVHLLQYMTGTKTKHFDHLLPFCKVLCGLNPFFPIHPAFRITQNEKDEIAVLLSSVIGHWSVLKNTSVEGLQETFIRREGLLEKSEKDWIVRIENRGVDVLLDDLPWDIHLIALPWNKYILFTEWKHD